jgi:hypothetical protein
LHANQLFHPAMPTRNELLADHFLKSAGIVAVYVDAAGAIGAVDAVGITAPLDCSLLCCASGNHAKVATLAGARAVAGRGQAAGMAAVRSAALEFGIGLTPHETVIRRAFVAVQTVDQRIVDLQRNGGMKEMNAEFKAARKAGAVLRYQDFLHAKKLAMLEGIARRL